MVPGMTRLYNPLSLLLKPPQMVNSTWERVFAFIWWKTILMIKIKINSISNVLKSLIKIYIKFWQKMDFEAFPQYSNDNLNNNLKKTWFQIWLNPLYIHPASRGVAAHTAGLFRSVRGAKGGVESPPWRLPKRGNFRFSSPWRLPKLPKLGNFHFSPPWGLPKLGNFHFSPPWGLPKLGNFHFSPSWGLPKLGNFRFSSPWGLPKLGNFHFSPPVGASQAREFSLFPPVGAPQAREFSLFPPVGAS